MYVEILTPDQVVYKGEATALTFPGIDGNFQVLNNHAPLIAALKNGTVNIETGNNSQTLEIRSGFVEVLNNNISVLVEKK